MTLLIKILEQPSQVESQVEDLYTGQKQISVHSAPYRGLSLSIL